MKLMMDIRKRKMLLVLPLLLLPFVALFFWALGGGKGTDEAPAADATTVLNADLPSAQLKDDAKMDKLGYYKQAESDSSKWREQLKQDPYARHDLAFPGEDPTLGADELSFERGGNGSFASPASGADRTEQQVYAKLRQLQSALQAPSDPPGAGRRAAAERTASPLDEAQVNRLSDLVEQVHARDATEADPELQQLNGMLDKIMAIQHPEQVKAVVAPAADPPLLPVSAQLPSLVRIGRLDTTPAVIPPPRFYSLDYAPPVDTTQGTLSAVVQDSRQVVNGARLRLRITQSFVVSGQVIPKDQFVYATVQLSNDCLQLTIAPLQYNGRIYPVGFAVYDLSGLPCIPVQGTLTGEAVRQTAAQSVPSLGAATLDPSLAAQAASTGIAAAKNLFTKKMKLVKVSLRAGHRLLLVYKTAL